jgi:hypothetical protein
MGSDERKMNDSGLEIVQDDAKRERCGKRLVSKARSRPFDRKKRG